jgi:hypothetical protein
MVKWWRGVLVPDWRGGEEEEEGFVRWRKGVLGS